MVGSFSSLTVSHTAALIAEKYKANSINWPSVYVCVNNCTDAQREELELTVSAMGCNSKRKQMYVLEWAVSIGLCLCWRQKRRQKKMEQKKAPGC